VATGPSPAQLASWVTVVHRIIFVFCVLVFRRGIGIVGVIASYVVARREASAGVKTPEAGGDVAGGTP
jgi:hypothetical protein